MLVINCSNDIDVNSFDFPNESSGVFTYRESANLLSPTANRSIVWRIKGDTVRLSEVSLNNNINYSDFVVVFKHSLIQPNGVSVHEVRDGIYVLITTLVSVHRLVFAHPENLQNQSSDSELSSIFAEIPVNSVDSPTNYFQIPTPFNENVNPPEPVFVSTCSWVNPARQACFALAKKDGTIQIIKFSQPDVVGDMSMQQIDLKQNSLLGMTKSIFTGFVPSYLKSAHSAFANESARFLLVHSNREDDLLFAVGHDSKIRVISLGRQECLITHDFALNQSSTVAINSIKFWWKGDNENNPLPNLIVNLTSDSSRMFQFYETIIPPNRSMTQTQRRELQLTPDDSQHREAHLQLLFDLFAPQDLEMVDYFVHKDCVWALFQDEQHSLSLQGRLFQRNVTNTGFSKQIQWIPELFELVKAPVLSTKSPLSNPREFYLNEIFWRSNFSMAVIFNGLNQVHGRPISEDVPNLKIDQLIREAISFVDEKIRTKITEDAECSAEEYSLLEEKFWLMIYSSCVELHLEENRPLRIFVDYKTGLKGVLRNRTVTFLPELQPFDNLLAAYSFLCDQTRNSTLIQSRISAEAWLKHQVECLVKPLAKDGNRVHCQNIESSILALIHGMVAMSNALSDEDLLNFDSLLKRISSLSCKSNLSLSDIASKISENPAMFDKKNVSLDSGLLDGIFDFFERCPLVTEVMQFMVALLAFEYGQNSYASFNPKLNRVSSEKINEKLNKVIHSHDTLPTMRGLLSSTPGLEFVCDNIRQMLNSRSTFCRDLFLFQFMLVKFRDDLKPEDVHCIMPIERHLIPRTVEVLFAYDFMNWASSTTMFNNNFWSKDSNHRFPKISHLPGSNSKNSFVSNDVVSILQLKEFLGAEKALFNAFPRSTVLYQFVRFSGAVNARRLVSHNVQEKFAPNMASGEFFSHIISDYLYVVCDLLWPFTAGQLLLAEFLLSSSQFNMLEQFLHRLNVSCMPYSASRSFLNGICSLVTSQGQKAIAHFKKSLSGIKDEQFLAKIFSPQSKFPLAELDPRTVSVFFCKLIQLFKKYSSYDLVIEITELAQRTLDKSKDVEYNSQQSIFSTTLFGSHLIMGNINQAYEAMLACVHPEEQKNCLQLFVMNLCDNGQFEKLVSFSYSGLEEEFVSVLEIKARISSSYTRTLDLVSNVSRFSDSTMNTLSSRQSTNFHHILYLYFVRIHNHRRAAQTLYDYYRKLMLEVNTPVGQEAVEVLKEQLHALLLARDCLKIVDPNQQWIVKNFIKKANHENDNNSYSNLKRKLGAKAPFQGTTQDRTIVDIVGVDSLLSEYELLAARLALLQLDPREYSIASSILSPDEIVTLCTSAALYRNAFRVAECFNLSVKPIFHGMTSKYLQIPNSTRNLQDPNNSVELIVQQFNDQLFNGSTRFSDGLHPQRKMWLLIMHYLKRHEKAPKRSSELMKTVVEELLANGCQIPSDLFTVYKRVNFPELLRLLMSYNFLPQATQISIQYMKAISDRSSVKEFGLETTLHKGGFPVCIPTHLFDCLMKILHEEHDEQQFKSFSHKKDLSANGSDASIVSQSSKDCFKSLIESLQVEIENLSLLMRSL